MKKIFLGIIASIVILVFLFTLGAFHPKEIYINDFKIKAPENMILANVTVDYHENRQNLFSPLLFKKNNKYKTEKIKDLSIVFSGSNRYMSTHSVNVRVSTGVNIKEFIKDIDNKNKYERKENNICIVYAGTIDDIREFHAIIKKEGLLVTILSYDKASALKILEQFCSE